MQRKVILFLLLFGHAQSAVWYRDKADDTHRISRRATEEDVAPSLPETITTSTIVPKTIRRKKFYNGARPKHKPEGIVEIEKASTVTADPDGRVVRIRKFRKRPEPVFKYDLDFTTTKPRYDTTTARYSHITVINKETKDQKPNRKLKGKPKSSLWDFGERGSQEEPVTIPAPSQKESREKTNSVSQNKNADSRFKKLEARKDSSGTLNPASKGEKVKDVLTSSKVGYSDFMRVSKVPEVISGIQYVDNSESSGLKESEGRLPLSGGLQKPMPVKSFEPREAEIRLPVENDSPTSKLTESRTPKEVEIRLPVTNDMRNSKSSVVMPPKEAEIRLPFESGNRDVEVSGMRKVNEPVVRLPSPNIRHKYKRIEALKPKEAEVRLPLDSDTSNSKEQKMKDTEDRLLLSDTGLIEVTKPQNDSEPVTSKGENVSEKPAELESSIPVPPNFDPRSIPNFRFNPSYGRFRQFGAAMDPYFQSPGISQSPQPSNYRQQFGYQRPPFPPYYNQNNPGGGFYRGPPDPESYHRNGDFRLPEYQPSPYIQSLRRSILEGYPDEDSAEDSKSKMAATTAFSIPKFEMPPIDFNDKGCRTVYREVEAVPRPQNAGPQRRNENSARSVVMSRECFFPDGVPTQQPKHEPASEHV